MLLQGRKIKMQIAIQWKLRQKFTFVEYNFIFHPLLNSKLAVLECFCPACNEGIDSINTQFNMAAQLPQSLGQNGTSRC